MYQHSRIKISVVNKDYGNCIYMVNIWFCTVHVYDKKVEIHGWLFVIPWQSDYRWMISSTGAGLEDKLWSAGFLWGSPVSQKPTGRTYALRTHRLWHPSQGHSETGQTKVSARGQYRHWTYFFLLYYIFKVVLVNLLFLF